MNLRPRAESQDNGVETTTDPVSPDSCKEVLTTGPGLFLYGSALNPDPGVLLIRQSSPSGSLVILLPPEAFGP